MKSFFTILTEAAEIEEEVPTGSATGSAIEFNRNVNRYIQQLKRDKGIFLRDGTPDFVAIFDQFITLSKDAKTKGKARAIFNRVVEQLGSDIKPIIDKSENGINDKWFVDTIVTKIIDKAVDPADTTMERDEWVGTVLGLCKKLTPNGRNIVKRYIVANVKDRKMQMMFGNIMNDNSIDIAMNRLGKSKRV